MFGYNTATVFRCGQIIPNFSGQQDQVLIIFN